MRSAIGRADLVRLVAALPAEQIDRCAALLGFDAPVQREAQVPAELRLAPALQELATPAAVEAAPMPFWRMEEMTFADAPEPTPVGVEPSRGLTDDDLRSPDRSLFAMPKAPLLAPWSRLWPLLRTALQTAAPGRDPDVPALVRAWGRGEIVRRIPRVPSRAWSARASVWVDRSARLVPFWSDQSYVCRLLQKVCGRSGLNVRLLDRCTQARAITRTGDLLAGYRPDPMIPVLVLGDLGTYGSPVERAAWLRTARRLRRAGARVAALVPSPEVRWAPAIARAWAAVAWERGRQGGGAVARREPRFWEERAERLLTLAAPAALVQPGLLRALRRLLPAWQADAATEADAWSHADVRAADATGLVLHAEAAERRRKEFVSEVEVGLKDRIAEQIGYWHGGLPRELLRAETLIMACALPGHGPAGRSGRCVGLRTSPRRDRTKWRRRSSSCGRRAEVWAGAPGRNASGHLRQCAKLEGRMGGSISRHERCGGAAGARCSRALCGARACGRAAVVGSPAGGQMPRALAIGGREVAFA